MTTTRTYPFTGSPVTFVVPPGVTELTGISVVGAGGGARGFNPSGFAGTGGLGCNASATSMAVTPGWVLTLIVGGRGGDANGIHHGVGGYNGGGPGAVGNGAGVGSGGGGGFSTIKLGSVALIIAAGGGGDSLGHTGGNGGDQPFGNGSDGGGPRAGLGGNGAGTTELHPVGGWAGGESSGSFGGQGGNATGSPANQSGGGGGGGGRQGGGGGGGGIASVVSAGGGGGTWFTSTTTTIVGAANNAQPGSNRSDGHITFSYNSPPNAPTLTGPPSNGYIDAALAATFSWTFSDDDATDSQAAADFRWRVGSGSWTTSTAVVTTTPFLVAAPGTWTSLIGQKVEWQVRTKDTAAVYGPWSASAYFTPVAAPGAPVIDNWVVDSQAPLLTFHAPNTAMRVQAQVLAGATVLFDQTHPLTAAPAGSPYLIPMGPPPATSYASGTTYTARIRYQQYPGVWSAWTTQDVVANIDAPLQPTAVVTPNPLSASVVLVITNPGSDPHPPTHNDVYRQRTDDGSAEIRIATDVAVNGTYIDTTAGAATYAYRVVAVTATGAITSSP